MDLTNFRFDVDADGIALLSWDMPDRSMNLITEQWMRELDSVIDHVAGDAEIKGCVITSAKDTFSGGADLSMLQAIAASYAQTLAARGEEEAMKAFFEASRSLSVLYRKLETCGKPFVAAINGLCLGGAFELALACHHRVMADGDAVRVGLPEVKIGIFPGAGGTQRVARLMQTGDALQMMFRGEQLRPATAKGMGLVHEVVPLAELIDKGKAWIKADGKAVAPWDEPNFRLPSGKIFSPQGMMIWSAANAIYRRETHDNFPGAKAILHSVYEGLQVPFDLGLRIESRWFAKILRSPEAAAMIRTLFVSMGELNKGARRPSHVPPSTPKKIGILGAGFMGAGVAYVTALAGIDVVLIDKDQATADKGKAYAEASISGQVLKGKAKTADKEKLLSHIQPSADYADLAGCDLVIEAVFEDRAIKAAVTQQAEAAMSGSAIFASNTSTLPITSLAGAFKRPEDFIGIHFFSPVEKMPLVEVILGQKTGDRALAMALDYVRAIKKTPIVVNDGHGFYANRCVNNYLREGHLMLLEGVPPALIENAAKMAGMPVGPLALSDEVAIDLIYKILKAMKAEVSALAVDARQEKLLETMVVTQGRQGRKNRKGFYDYPEKATKSLWPGLLDLQETKLDPETIDVAELKQRFLAVQAVEAIRTMEEGIVTDPREADVGSIIGFGFPPFTGGVLSYVDGMGAAGFLALCERLAAAHGARFAPPPLLQDLAKTGESFYGHFAKQAKAAA